MLRVFMLISLMLIVAAPAAAQSTPVARPATLAELLPPAADLGPNWIRIDVGAPDISDDSFTNAISANYGGPQGARLMVILFRHDTDRGSVLEAWDDAQDWYDSARYDAVSLDYDYTREREIASLPLPEGIAQAVRLDGRDRWSWQPVGLGLYAIEPDVIAVILLEGATETNPNATGVAGMDLIASLIAARMSR